MSEGSISQEEIDALLSGVDVGGIGSGGSFSSGPEVSIDVPTLQNFANGMTDKLAEVIKNMTQQEVSCASPTVETAGRDQLLAKVPEVVIAVMADYSAGLGGDHLFLMPSEMATKLVGFINQEENPALDDMGLSVISEVVSAFSGSEITELSKSGKLPGLATNPPEAVNQPKAMIRMPQGTFALFTYPVTMAGENYTIWEAVSGPVADGMAKALGGGAQAAAPAMDLGGAVGGAAPSMAQPQMQMGGMGMAQPQMMGGMGMAPQMQMGMQQPMGGNMMGGMGMAQPQMMGGMPMQTPPNVQSLQFPNFVQGISSAEQGNISLIMDVFMEMTVELGRTKKTIKDILGLGEGTIIELDKLAGEPVDILVNHKPIAKGEVVVIDENFGVRVTEILPSLEHVASSM
ncbi:flagellar motor switch protein FliN [Treponema sp.]|uniref:flagellar motor switch protein FliN n=1 Tax=Treponema sp. TaxID=166 RepID=UPI001D9A20CB|nr:flagellar motor switch protein FliN [Treponema sp.]MBS7242173.1 flagellar motor switch protein FliN [Treponema sp.]MCI6442769.1 flagellar motor switch protein FliN [Spirochaetia bacterium]